MAANDGQTRALRHNPYAVAVADQQGFKRKSDKSITAARRPPALIVLPETQRHTGSGTEPDRNYRSKDIGN